jgi:hypothetical protein
MSDDERSSSVNEEEDEEEVSNQGSDNEENEDSDNKSEDNEEEEDNEEKEDDDEEKNDLKETTGFDNAKLSLTNEIKLDLNTPNEKKIENEKSFTFDKSIGKTDRTHKSILLISQINDDLDDLYDNLFKNVKTFDKQKKVVKITEPIEETRSKEPSSKNIKNITKSNTLPSIYPVESQERQLTRVTAKKYTEKEMNTSYHSQRQRIKNESSPEAELVNDQKMHPPSYYYKMSQEKQKTHIRSIEDLYGTRNKQPVIYSRENPYHTFKLETKKPDTNRPRNINQAIDILLDN